MTFSRGAYRKAVKDYDRKWRVQDGVLYKLCRTYGAHNDSAGVYAKLSIIGRTYSTGIERNIKADGSQSSSMERLAKHMLQHSADVIAIFKPLAALRGRLTAEMLRTIIVQHGKFVTVLKPLLRKHHSARSFCSKYMHFHCPAVPIFDTYADRALRKAIRWKNSLPPSERLAGADERYGRYVRRFWQLYRQAGGCEPSVSVRLLDRYLLIEEGRV